MTFLRSHEKLKIVIKYSFQTFHKEDGCLPLLISAEYALEKGMATHSSSLAWGSLWIEEPEGYSPWGRRVGHNWAMNTSTMGELGKLIQYEILFFYYYYFFFFLLYNIVLVLPYINMHPPQVYMCSPSWTPLPPPSPYHPSGSSQCTSPKLPVSCIEPYSTFSPGALPPTIQVIKRCLKMTEHLFIMQTWI